MLRYFKENREILVTKTIKYHQNSSLSYRLNYQLLFSPTSPCKSCVKLVWPSILSLVFMCRMIISILHASVYIECTDECVFLSIILYYIGLLEGVADKKTSLMGILLKDCTLLCIDAELLYVSYSLQRHCCTLHVTSPHWMECSWFCCCFAVSLANHLY